MDDAVAGGEDGGEPADGEPADDGPADDGPDDDERADDEPGVTPLATAVSANFAQFGARVVISPFVLPIIAAYGVDKGAVGAALTVMWATFALLQFPGGVVADRHGEKPVMLAAMGLTAVGSALVASAPTFPVFVVAMVALGVGTGLYFPTGTAFLARRYRRRGRAFGVHSAGGPLAGLLLPVVATAVAVRYDWRAGVAVGGAAAALAFLLVVVGADRRPPTAPERPLRGRLHPRQMRSLLGRPGVAFAMVLALISMYIFQSFISFFPTFLQEYHGFASSEASLAFGLAFGMITLGLTLVGVVTDRYGVVPGLVGPFLLTAAGVTTVLLAPGRVVVYAGIVVAGAGLTWAAPLQSMLIGQFGPDERAGGFGMARTVYVLLGSVGNVTTGFLAEAAGWRVAYGLLVVLVLIATGLVVGRERWFGGSVA